MKLRFLLLSTILSDSSGAHRNAAAENPTMLWRSIENTPSLGSMTVSPRAESDGSSQTVDLRGGWEEPGCGREGRARRQGAARPAWRAAAPSSHRARQLRR